MTEVRGTPVLGPTRSRVYDLSLKGLNGNQIAKVLGISHQSVYQHLKELRRKGHIR